MRKSSDVPLTLLAAVALFATGCRDVPETRNCVDRQGRIAPEGNCQAHSGGGGFYYLYGGRSGGHVGDVVVGGNTSPGRGGVTRGGFGHAGGGEGGGE